MKKNFNEVRCTFEDEGVWYVDAWETDDDNESGVVVATINENTFEVNYLLEEYKTPIVIEAVKEKLRELLK